VQLKQIHHCHERIFVNWLQRRQRYPNFLCKLKQKEKVNDHQQNEQADNKKSRKELTTSKSRNLVQTLGDGFLSLNALLISIRKCLLRFLRLGRCCFGRFLSTGLSGSGNILGFLGSFEFGFKGFYASIGRRQSICSMAKRKRYVKKRIRRKSARQAEGITQ
jgi:hypothetical protein